ncbi:putative uncharacterized protein DDB_G0290521 [Rhagoletis pomonella]|uniref:putative uncharacterized protein DDB_G0290521 n=1 Tax=Rhagoletis pomonella TaxID=28610 RepID=UPI00177F27AB|nr:putative uncharacterized protein DDB_G0290521 [Rhagoletis pomonella]
MDILTSGPQSVPSPVPQSYPYAAAAPSSTAAHPPSSTAAHPPSPTAVPSPSPSPQTSSPLSSPVELSSSSPLDTSNISSTAASTSSKRKRNYMGEVGQLAKEQNELLKVVIDDGKVLTAECVNAIKEQSSATKEFISLMKSVLEKM